MQESELIDVLAQRLGSRQSAAETVRTVASTVMAEVASGGQVSLPGFGLFYATGFPPMPSFRPGTAFRNAVAAGLPDGPLAKDAGGPVWHQTHLTKEASTRLSRTVHARPLHLRHFDLPAGTSLSAILPDAKDRCGIYVLIFDDGHRYVGQARNVVARFSAHRRRWGERIVAVDFASAPAGELNDLERRTINDLEREGIGLYNSALVGLPMGESRLDLIVDRVEQARWLDESAAAVYDLGDRRALAASRARARQRFAELADRDDYPLLRVALFRYLMNVVPWPHETEQRFWSITSMPNTSRSSTARRLCAISVNNMETLVIDEVLDAQHGWMVGGFINVAPGMVDAAGFPMDRSQYRTAGEVDTISFLGTDGLLHLLEHPRVVQAGKRLALGLIRKGPGMMAKYHNVSFADDVFAAQE
jgi:hypothetical protein